MRFKTFIYYLDSVLAILVGAFLSTAPPTDPVLAFLMRIGHGLIFFGAAIIIGMVIGVLVKRKRMKSLSTLFIQESGKFNSPPWLLKKEGEKLIITTNPRFSLMIIIGSIVCYSILLYIVIPSLDAIVAGTIEISLGNIILLLISASLLAGLFIFINLWLILRRIEKVIDKKWDFLYVSKGFKGRGSHSEQLDPGKNILEVDLANLNKTKVELKGYYRLLIPMEGARGDLESYKSWIFEDYFLLIQSRNEKFIKELDSELKRFITR